MIYNIYSFPQGRAPRPAHVGFFLLRGAPRDRERAVGGQPLRVLQGRQRKRPLAILHAPTAQQDRQTVSAGVHVLQPTVVLH